MMQRIWNWLTSPCSPENGLTSGMRYEPLIDIRFEIARLDLRPGDLLVLKIKERLPMEGMRRVKEMMEGAIGGHKCLVLEGGADLAILTAADIEAKTETEGRAA